MSKKSDLKVKLEEKQDNDDIKQPSDTSNIKDDTGLTPKERHDIVIKLLTEIKKSTAVFHMRWKPGQLITQKTIIKTPLFWYFKHNWKRIELEKLFYRTKVEIDDALDTALFKVFGGKRDKRYINPKRKKKDLFKWKLNEMKKNKKKKLKDNQKDIWGKLGKNEKEIDFKTFMANLKELGITIDDKIGKILFDEISKNGVITESELSNLITKISNMKLTELLKQITIDDLKNSDLNKYIILQELLKSIMNNEEFDVHILVGDAYFDIDKDNGCIGINYLEKLADRDVKYEDRIDALTKINENFGKDDKYNDLLKPQNADILLCGWIAQMLDTKNEKVQKLALEGIGNIFAQIYSASPETATKHLEDIIDAIFAILDDAKAVKNHANAEQALRDIVSTINSNNKDIPTQLLLSTLLTEKTKIENVTNANARRLALEQIISQIFTNESPYLISKKINYDINKIPKIDENKLPKKDTINREWLDTVINKVIGPKLNDVMSKEIGDKYRNIISDGISSSIMDPNIKNREIGKKYTDLFNEYMKGDWYKVLSAEAKKRYIKNNPDLLKFKKKSITPVPKRALPDNRNSIKLVQHDVTSYSTISMKKPFVPDI